MGFVDARYTGRRALPPRAYTYGNGFPDEMSTAQPESQILAAG
jgi:hypothetical protein